MLARPLKTMGQQQKTPLSGHQDQLLQLAQQRNLEALTTLIDQKLAEQVVKVAEIEFKNDLLQLSVESSEVPEQSVTVPLIRDFLSQLRLPEVTAVTIYGQKIGSRAAVLDGRGSFGFADSGYASLNASNYGCRKC